MLLSKLSQKKDATYWSKQLKESKELIIASERDANTTILDILIKKPVSTDIFLTGTLELSDDQVQELVEDSGMEFDELSDACSWLANLIDETCVSSKQFQVKQLDDNEEDKKTFFEVHLKKKVETGIIDVILHFRLTCVSDIGVSQDLIRLMGIFSKEPRKETSSKKRVVTQASQEGGEHVPKKSKAVKILTKEDSKVVKKKKKL